MKKFLLSVLLPSILVGCTNSLDEVITSVPNAQESESISSHHFVTLDAVTTLTRAQTNMTRSSSDIRSRITCYADNTRDTLLYICDNSEGGWVMYSSDTRVPPIVAQSGSGTFADAMKNENIAWWIKGIAEDMKAIRGAADHELNFSKEEIESNTNFWESVSAPDKFIKEHVTKNLTRGKDGPGTIPQGHYELISSTYHTEVYDSIPRLTETNWHQGYPFNNYCPYISGDSTYRSPAGCVAIAGAQMLYFLHYELGVPQTAPSEAYCYGSNDTNYDWAQYNYTTEIWDIMNNGNGSNAAPFIANVGLLCQMNYGDNGSGSDLEKLTNAFTAYGIDCTLSTYSTNNIQTSLLNGMPVVLGANDNVSGKGHAFMADKYKRTRGVQTNTYEWVYDYVPTNPDGSIVLVPILPHKVEHTYYSPTISMIGMNWGDAAYLNYGWYSLTGDWIAGNFNFTVNRKMLHNFEAINN